VTPLRIAVGPIAFRPADVPVLSGLAALAAVAALVGRVAQGPALAARTLAVTAAYLGAIRLEARLPARTVRPVLRFAAVTLALAYLFGAVAPLQLVLHGRWLDQSVLDLEQAALGVQPTLWLERCVRPWLTEWLMFTYVIYLALYPALAVLLWERHGEAALEHYLLALALANVACDVGFVLYPVAGPLPFMGARYTVPLDGWGWTWLAGLLRDRAHYVGGTIPSPHCAAATVMWGVMWRWYRPAFWALAAVIVSLYLSTVYGRFHYLTDAVAGVAAALGVLAIAPRLLAAWSRVAGRRIEGAHSVDRARP
jgi:membrane-associated phospholipid phosphatase